ncbi:MAG: hypothetical protein Q9199_001424 [Rusavskia elegans]
MGGSSQKDGLALYPMQWMLAESQSQGLALEFEQLKSPCSGIDNPLRVVFPVRKKEGKGREMETFTTKNGINVQLHDLRKVHALPQYQGRYSIKINSLTQFYWAREARKIFNADEELRGYSGWAPQGTIIHPSVYQCLESFIIQTLPLRTRHHVANQGSWNDEDADPLENNDLKTIRILVCGNTGVGKSTLINRVFGINPDDREVCRPKYLIAAAEGMIFEMKFATNIVEILSYMIQEDSKLVTNPKCGPLPYQNTPLEVPVIVVATKMYNFRGIQPPDDPKSIDNLSRVTLENVKDEKLQLLYIATQTASVNLKIDAAVKEVMRIYTKVLGTASASGIVPTASATNRAGSAIAVCRAIVQCFGLPTVNTQTILEIIKSIVWDDAGQNVMVAFSEVVATAGMVVTVGSFGMPFSLAAGALNFPLVVPATTRLMLMLASNLILILVRAFRITTTTCVGQPEEKDVVKAAKDYRLISADVHIEIFKLVPKRNVVKSFRYSKVRVGLKRIIEDFKEEVVKDLSLDRSGRDTATDKDVEESRKIFSDLWAEVNAKDEQIQQRILEN